MKRFVVKGITIAILVVTLLFPPVTSAFADTGPSITPDTGQPGSSAGNTCGNNGLASSPSAGAADAPGSVFNGSGEAGEVYAGNMGSNSLANANSTAAVSQYDIACLQTTPP